MSKININVEQSLADEVKIITKKKFPLRKIEFYSEAIKEALIDFVRKNQEYKE